MGELSFVVDKLLSGLVVGVDFDVPSGGPGTYLLFTVLSEAFPPFLDVYWSVVLFVRVAISALALELGRRVLPGLWTLLPLVCLLVAPGALPSGFFMACTLLLTLACVHYLRAPGWRRALVLGLTVLVTGFVRLDMGAFGLLTTFVLCISSRERRPHLSFGILPPLLALSLVLSWTTDLSAVLSPVLGQVWADAVGTSGAQAKSLVGPALVFFGLPLVVYGSLLVRWWRAGGLDPTPVVLVGLGFLTMKPWAGAPSFAGFLEGAPLLYFAVALLLADLVSVGEATDESERLGTRRLWGALAIAMLLPAGLAAHTVVGHRGSLQTGSWTIPEGRTVALDTL
ncbi:MAG TPA: hypothetical protein DIU15_16110, partial [Deltaproteobacteria bacterium]|nr:hypothetical protein [Deltaproteobacteria bacterium]